MMKKLSDKTLQSALGILDTQYNYCLSKLTATETQKAYYEGMKTMLHIILSNNFEKSVAVGYSDFARTHYVIENAWGGK